MALSSPQQLEAEAKAPTLTYADPGYWTGRYQADSEPFDWYLRWEQVKELLLPLLALEHEILVLGSGTSLLSEQLYAEGFMNVTNVDRCEVAINAMRDRHTAQREAAVAPPAKGKAAKASPEPPVDPLEGKPPMRFEVVEAGELPQEWASSFNVIIDKAMLDSVACGKQKMKATAAVLASASRVLRPSGAYVCISWAPPDMRWGMLAASDCDDRGRTKERPEASVEYSWGITHKTVPRPLVNPQADPKSKEKIELSPSPAFVASEHVYHIYTCTKL